MTNCRRKRGNSDEPKVRNGYGDCNDTNKKRSIANKLTFIDAAIHDPHLLVNGDNDEVKVEPQQAQADGSETSRLFKWTVHHNAGAGDMDVSPQQQRRMWVKDRSGTWWKHCSSPDYPEDKFRSHFRMGWDTFDMICDALGSAIAKEDTPLRPAIPVRQRVAVCIWRLATGEPLRAVSDRFGLGLSTCQKIVLEVCAAIRKRLMPHFLRWPDQVAAFKGSFKAISDVPDVIGAMYTTHVPIIAPKSWISRYYNIGWSERNKKPSFSTTLQGVVDPNGIFTDVCIGWPGAMHDDKILVNSLLHQQVGPRMMPGSWVVGSSSYPLMNWLLVPYTDQNLSKEQYMFNEKLTKLQRVAVDAFARLKGRWKFLQKRAEMKISDLPAVMGACCVLHNICEMKGEEMGPELQCDVIDIETVPDYLVHSESASKARDKMAHDIFHGGLGCTSF
ncbi:protein ALP1-like [Lolium rigidum]|uniref:protein ALP1-like n=1 Tax=Lolium rigidum TaxID=89674 RepID=UPI001F5C46EB|nr:protein ALP1-like [Lolium rigidum]